MYKDLPARYYKKQRKVSKTKLIKGIKIVLKKQAR